MEAARFQLVVLVGIMLAETICGIIVTRVLSRATVIVSPDEEPEKKHKKKAEDDERSKGDERSEGGEHSEGGERPEDGESDEGEAAAQ